MHYTQENCIRGGKSQIPHGKMGYEIIVTYSGLLPYDKGVKTVYMTGPHSAEYVEV